MRSKGFTLIELMIVVAILGILLAIAIPAFRIYLEKETPENIEIDNIKNHCDALDIEFPRRTRDALKEIDERDRKHLVDKWKIKCGVSKNSNKEDKSDF